MRIAIVNDMPMALEGLRRVVQSTGEHEIAWMASGGQEAVACCAEDLPDLVLMDIIMPEMNGVETTRQIMRSSPCPILVVTSSVHSNSALVFEAMGNGALDAVNTPVLMGESAGSAQEALLLKISMLNVLTKSRSSDTVSVVPRVIKEPICFERTSEKALESASEKSTEKAAENACASDFSIAAERSANKKPALQSISLVAIGASSGGPQALATVLKGLPADYNSAIVIVQHVDVQFSQGLADWLNQQITLPVRLAKPGDRPHPGQVLLAGTDDHLVLQSNGELNYIKEPKDFPYRPSVDVFWNSLTEHWNGPLTAVLLTGMGRDGAKSMLELRRGGAFTVAQDEASCAVFGMPKAAINLNAAKSICAIEKISDVIIQNGSSNMLSWPNVKGKC
ncbi:MAG: chemotaxis response regulator protein-glutamate methylesterase [Ectothiorhodospiraceae bacterium]|nr:chemotaxis response regulator protein-glutamate methylesterase [Ectothiorhodospiraceae bacterium]